MTETIEQIDIIYAEEPNIIIAAGPGTGKTSTLIKFSRHRPFDKFLYIVYNSSVRKEAKKKFFGNTDVHTIHSLAYEYVGKLYANKLTENLRIFDIIKGLKLKNDNFFIANEILNVLQSFFNSTFKEISELEVDVEILKLAEKYWKLMQSQSDIKMTYDGYLKLFHLTEPQLKYSYILVDEVQDSNEVMLDIVLRQEIKKVFVGDIHQEIYGYRNIINILKNIPDNFTEYKLTKSFRFGNNIAEASNNLLRAFKEDIIDISGNGLKSEIGAFNKDEPYTIITRTNAHLFDLLVEIIDKKEVYVIGHKEEIFNPILDAYHLYNGNLFKVKSSYIKSYRTFNKMKDISEKIDDIEISFLIKIVEKYTYKIPEIINILEKKVKFHKKYADVILTTAHKSKGLEFFNVKLADDFFKLFNSKGNLNKNISESEVNIYYVAMTRSIEKLEPNKELKKLLTFEKK
jgi:superfamily I DNA/RNA helicase